MPVLLRLVPLLVFILPAAWAMWLVGKLLREGLAMLLYYRLADLTPWIIAHHDTLAWASLTLAALANLLLLVEVEMRHVRTGLIAILSLTSGVLWMATALVQPGWWLAPFNGLLMFTVINTPMASALLTNLTLRDDDLVPVLGKVLLVILLIALLQFATLMLLPQ